MTRRLIAMAGILILVGATLSGHHSYAAFDTDHPVTVTGTLVSILYVQPHVILTLRTTDAQVYKVTWGSPSTLERIGVRPTTFKTGDELIVRGAPSRDQALRELSMVRAVERPSDGRVWSRS